MIRFYSNIGCSESKVIFMWRKNNKNESKKTLQGANVRTSCISFSLNESHNCSQSELSQNDTNADKRRVTNARNSFNKQKNPPWACDKGCAEACAGLCRSFSRLEDQHWRHVVSSPLRGHFGVFRNARILIFYLSMNAWEENSLPKSHLGWFFLVFVEGKARKENISMFWFILPEKCYVSGWKIYLLHKLSS